METDLDNVMRKTRTELTKHRKYHPKASTLRITLPRAEGGRGLTDIKNLHNGQIKTMRTYFHQRKISSPLYHALNLVNEQEQSNAVIHGKEEKRQEWRSKTLHGRHPHELDQPHVNISASNAWLSSGELFPETEDFMIVIQDQVITTKNYLKHIVKDTHTPEMIGAENVKINLRLYSTSHQDAAY